MPSSQNFTYESFIDGTSANQVSQKFRTSANQVSAKFRTFLFHDVGEITSSEKVKKVAGACGHLYIQLL
jgi:hypothetical protein